MLCYVTCTSSWAAQCARMLSHLTVSSGFSCHDGMSLVDYNLISTLYIPSQQHNVPAGCDHTHRARLDQAVARLNRIIAAIEMEQTRPSPRTVERVLLRANSSGAHTPSFRHGGDQADAEAATRRRLARDLNGAATTLA